MRGMTATAGAQMQNRMELVVTQAEDKVGLQGLLWEPQTRGDSMVLMVPGGTTGAALFPAHDYSPLARLLTERGYALLVTNMRASYNNPYSEYGDAVKDIAGFVAYAKARGYARMAVLGISLGGPRMAQYVVERGDPAVKAVGFIASIPSPYLEYQGAQQRRRRRSGWRQRCRLRAIWWRRARGRRASSLRTGFRVACRSWGRRSGC